MPEWIFKPERPPKWRFGFLGVPHDAATTLGRPGARYAPDRIRGIFRDFVRWGRVQDGMLAEVETDRLIDMREVEVADFGNVPLAYYDPEVAAQQTTDAVKAILDQGYFPLIVGGDHGITFPCIRALHDTTTGRVGIIQIDGHLDLMDRNPSQGHLSGSSVFRRTLELGRVRGANIVQVGVRGYARTRDLQAARESGLRRITAQEFRRIGPERAAERALDWAGDGTERIYFTLDIDGIDPAHAPGGPWPEPGGLVGVDALDFIRRIAGHLHAADIAEVNPLIDLNETASIFAVRALLDIVVAQVSRVGH